MANAKNQVKRCAAKVGDDVIVRAGCYAPVTYGINGEQLRHTLGTVVESFATFVSVRFIGYPNTVDMTRTEVETYRAY